MNYYVEGLSTYDNRTWFRLSEPFFFEETYCYMLRLSNANPGYKYRVTSINRLK